MGSLPNMARKPKYFILFTVMALFPATVDDHPAEEFWNEKAKQDTGKQKVLPWHRMLDTL